MADRIILDGTTSLELSARGAGSDVRSWERDAVGERGARLFVNNIAEPGVVDTVVNLHRGSVLVGTTEARGKVTVEVGGFNTAVQAVAVRGDALRGQSDVGHGVSGLSREHTGTEGGSETGIGVHGLSGRGPGVRGESNDGPGVVAMSVQGLNVMEARVVNQLIFAVQRNGTVVADGPFTGPADFAEMLPAVGASSDYEPGDLLSIAEDGRLTRTATPQSYAVAGVLSERPGFVGDLRITTPSVGDGLAEDAWVCMAVVGVVPVKASAENGPICPGDLLVSAETPGHAMRSRPARIGDVQVHPAGAIFGKSLDALVAGCGLIRVLLGQR